MAQDVQHFPEGQPSTNLKSTLFNNLLLLGFDPQLSSSKMLNEHMFSRGTGQDRIFEYVVSFLLESLDTKAFHDKLHACWPIFNPAQAKEFRNVVYKWLEELKRNDGIFPIDVQIRRSQLDECRGERIERLLLCLANHVLKTVLAKEIGEISIVNEIDHCRRERQPDLHLRLQNETAQQEQHFSLEATERDVFNSKMIQMQEQIKFEINSMDTQFSLHRMQQEEFKNGAGGIASTILEMDSALSTVMDLSELSEKIDWLIAIVETNLQNVQTDVKDMQKEMSLFGYQIPPQDPNVCLSPESNDKVTSCEDTIFTKAMSTPDAVHDATQSVHEALVSGRGSSSLNAASSAFMSKQSSHCKQELEQSVTNQQSLARSTTTNTPITPSLRIKNQKARLTSHELVSAFSTPFCLPIASEERSLLTTPRQSLTSTSAKEKDESISQAFQTSWNTFHTTPSSTPNAASQGFNLNMESTKTDVEQSSPLNLEPIEGLDWITDERAPQYFAAAASPWVSRAKSGVEDYKSVERMQAFLAKLSELRQETNV